MQSFKITPISNDKKQMLGLLIKLERKRKDLKQKELITDTQQTQICSLSTLQRIEKGQIVKDDVVYHKLIDRMGYFFKENTKIDKAIHLLNKKCMRYFESLNLEEAEIILNEVHSIFDTTSFYYTHMKQFYLDMIESNLFRKILTRKEYHQYKALINYASKPINILLIHMCFCFANNYIQNIQEMSCYENLLRKNSSFLIMRIDLQLILKCNNRLEEYLELNTMIINETESKQLINQRCKVIASRCTVLSTIQYPLLHKALNDLEYLIYDYEKMLNPVIVNNIKYTMAMIYFSDILDYNKAIELFEYVFDMHPLKIESAGIYYFSSCEITKQKPKESILKNICLDNVYLRYFKFKYQPNWSKEELVHYLNTTVLKALIKDKNSLKIRVFKTEWKFLMQEHPDKYYKAYYSFMANFE